MISKAVTVTAALCMTAATAVAQDTTELEAITVTGDVADTSTSYALPKMRSATKTDTPVLETPQALTVLTRKQFDDQNPQTVGQALRYTAGVLSEIDASTRYDSVFLRGFGGFGTSTAYAAFLDGLRLPRGQAFAQAAVDPFLLDRVDVLKGPSGLLYGQTSPGGLVNMTLRSPDGSSSGEARLEVGSNNRVQTGLAQHGTLDAEGKLQYSVAMVGRDAGSRYADVDEQRLAVAPVLVWQPTDQTRLTFGAFWQRDPEGGYFNSIYPTSLAPDFAEALDRDLNIGDPGYEGFDRTQTAVFAGIEHGFAPGLTLRSKLRAMRVESDMKGIQMVAPVTSTGDLYRAAVHSVEEVEGLAWDTNLEYETETGAIQHQLLAGADLQWTRASWAYELGAAPTLNVLTPGYGGSIGPFATYIDNTQTTRQQGLYLSDQMSFGAFRAVLGARRDWVSSDTDNHLTDTVSSQDSAANSVRAALLYDLGNGAAPYLSYATSFEPVAGVDADGNAFVPSRGKQWEAGLKFQPEGSDALFTLAAFDIRQENLLTPSTTPGFSVQTGEIRSRGIEMEARGKLTEQLELIGALTLLDTEVTRSNAAGVVGKRPQAVPEHFGSLWLNYAFAGRAEGLELGGGVRFVGASYADDANTVKADSYRLVDVGMRYDLGMADTALAGTKVALNIRNLTEETYYASCSYGYYCQYGEGRTVTLSLQKTW